MKRTGIKIFFRKILHHSRYPYDFMRNNKILFPENGFNGLKTGLWLYTLKNEIKSWRLEKKLGFLHSQPHPLAVKVWKNLISLNPNNLGIWSKTPDNNLSGTTRAEKNLISKMINLYGGVHDKWTGYVTSGATEANLLAAWAGRNYLRSRLHKGKICMLVNPFTHYSIKKAANVVDLPCIEIGSDRQTLVINTRNLINKIKSLQLDGYSGFLIPLTLGYTQTGANDRYEDISKILSKLENEIGIKCFIWLDAAINGLIFPFIKSKFSPLKIPGINLIAVDFHKTGMCPIPSGVAIYQDKLTKYIDQKVAYLEQNDATVAGSRSGIAAAAALAIVDGLGKKGFKKLIAKAFIEKNKFLNSLYKQKLDIEIFNDKNSPALALISRKALPSEVVNQFGIYAKKWSYGFDQGTESLYIYKINFPLKAI